MNLLSADSVGKSIADRWLFKNLTFGLNQGQRVAMVGANGVGKTTLLNILGGLDLPDEGQVSVRRGARIGFLGQNPNLDNTLTIRQLLFGTQNPALEAIAAYEQALETHSDDGDLLQTLMTRIDELGAWDTEVRVHQILSRLGVGDMDRLVGHLSGGQRKRVALAQVLLDEPDVLLLDEPTNHLDLETIEWLENVLATQATTLLMITHDRYFLDRVANEVVEMANGELFSYKGNYSTYVEQKAMREVQQATEVEKARNLYRKELDWMRRQPQARGTKQKARVDAFYETEKKAKTQLGGASLELSVKTTRQGNKILEVEHLTKHYGGARRVVNDFTYVFRKGERLGIVGPNGAGKTTLLNMLTGRLAADGGTREVGQTTVFGYYTQHELTYRDDQRVIDVVKEVAEVITMADGSVITAGQLLQQFQFAPAQQYTFVSKLSGGQKRRLQLLRVLMANPNFLILDEPTNDLDIPTLNVLEDFLLGFPGCLVIVSHDRYFMDQLVEQVLVFEGHEGRIRSFPGNYTDYRQAEKDAAREEAAAETPKPVAPEKASTKHSLASIETPAAPKKRKPTFAEQKEYEQLESEIAALETRKTALEADLSSGHITDHARLHALAADIKATAQALEAKELRWLELADLM